MSNNWVWVLTSALCLLGGPGLAAQQTESKARTEPQELKEFKEFSSGDGRFKVQMPGTPKVEKQAAAGTTMHRISAELKGGAYVVMYADLPIPADEPAEQIQGRLAGSRDGALRNTGAKLTKETKITLDKYAGREIDAELPKDRGVMRIRLFFVGTRLYQVMSIGRGDWNETAETKKFFDSFAFTK